MKYGYCDVVSNSTGLRSEPHSCLLDIVIDGWRFPRLSYVLGVAPSDRDEKGNFENAAMPYMPRARRAWVHFRTVRVLSLGALQNSSCLELAIFHPRRIRSMTLSRAGSILDIILGSMVAVM